MTERLGNKNGRVVILLIAGLPVTMILAATWLWFFVAHGDLDLVGLVGTGNNGRLVETPINVSEWSFADETGAELVWSDLGPRWKFVLPQPSTLCSEDCQERLYKTRQIHIAVGRDFNRVSRIIALPQSRLSSSNYSEDFENLMTRVRTDHKGLLIARFGKQDWMVLDALAKSYGPGWFLVDPAGWVMMFYDDKLSYKEVLRDLKFLLKNSGG